MKVGVAVVDVLAGYAAATGVLAALVAGRGERIEISLYDIAVSALVNVSGIGARHRRGARALRQRPPEHRPVRDVRRRRRPDHVAGANDGLYRRLCAAIERPDLAEDERYATNPLPGRATAKSSWRELERVFASRPADEWVERLARRGRAGRQGARRARGARGRDERSRSIIRRSARCHSSRRRSGRGRKPGRRRCSASTRGRCLGELGYDEEEIEALLLPSSA